ncbi:hypothetical protein MN608_02519 [Microdochium nivale]|nr:hypothetical protein MN608_02519 [Microdochium nivale]
MSSRELIPDVFASLYKKARRSWSQHRTVPKNVAQGEEQQPRHDSAVSFDTTVVCKDSTMTAISTQGASSHTKEHKAVALMVADPGSPRQDNSQVLVAATSGTDRQDQQPSEPAAATSTLNYIHRIFLPSLPRPSPPRDANTSQPDQQPAFSSPGSQGQS